MLAVRLQELDSRLAELTKEIASLPKHIAEIEKKLESHQRKLDAWQQLDAGLAPTADDPAAGQASQLELLYAAIRELEPLDRSLVLLQLDEASYAQIAEIHGLSESNVGVRLNRIRHKLTTLIQEKTS